MSSSSSEEEQLLQSTPPEILNEAKIANESLIPEKSKEKYLAAYDSFLEWKTTETPREIRNKAEKHRRDKLNHSISELASVVPPVVASNRKIDKTGVLRLTAHYLRAYQYVFGDSIGRSGREFTPGCAQALLSLLNGFLLTTTYKGLVVVVSPNIQQYLGYVEYLAVEMSNGNPTSQLDLLGHSIFNYVHPEDVDQMKQHLMPKSHLLGPNGELLLPEELEGRQRIAAKLANDKRRFMVRFKKLGQRSEPVVYVTCYVEGTLRKADRASHTPGRGYQIIRRARARGDNPYSSGNDVVFVGIVRPSVETFITERQVEAFRMEYRTRHSVDGEIMECEQRISLVAGYMTHEVNGINAMNFMHRDDVRWVIFTLKEMYEQHQLVGESCYRLMAKNGQFLYMRTRGVLDVDEQSKTIRSMVCTNTVVDEKEGKHLIRLMKQKCLTMFNRNKSPARGMDNPQLGMDTGGPSADETLEAKALEKVLHCLIQGITPAVQDPSLKQEKSKPLKAIDKIYSILKNFQSKKMKKQNRNEPKKPEKTLAVPEERASQKPRSPYRQLTYRLVELSRRESEAKKQVEGFTSLSANSSPQRLQVCFRHTASPRKHQKQLPPECKDAFEKTQSKKVTEFGLVPGQITTYIAGQEPTYEFQPSTSSAGQSSDGPNSAEATRDMNTFISVDDLPDITEMSDSELSRTSPAPPPTSAPAATCKEEESHSKASRRR